MTAARQLGFTRIACASTGNLANSVAAARGPGRDALDRASSRPTWSRPRSSRPRSTAARWSPSRAPTTTSTGCAPSSPRPTQFESTAFVNVNVRPYYAEGSKTLGFEVAEQLGWRLPEQVVVPMASGSLLTKVDKAFAELAALGLVEDRRLAGVRRAVDRAARRSSTAFAAGRDVVAAGPADRHREVAGHRQPGRRAVRARRGAAHRRRDRRRQRRRDPSTGSGCWPGPTGIFAETAGGVTVAMLRKLLESGHSTRRRRPSSTTPVTG